MKNYKLGNKIDCIVRAKYPGVIGDITINHENQPYTIIKDIDASITFDSRNKNATSMFVNTHYNTQKVEKVELSNVLLTDKILNLIFTKSEALMFPAIQNCEAEDNTIYLSLPYGIDNIYNVFVYDTDGNLEEHYDVLNSNSIKVLKNENYLVFYNYTVSNTVNLDSQNSQYFALDLLITGNTDDETSHSCIHIDKCVLQVDKNMSFGKMLNTVDLTFIVINEDKNNNYLIIE